MPFQADLLYQHISRLLGEPARDSPATPPVWEYHPIESRIWCARACEPAQRLMPHAQVCMPVNLGQFECFVGPLVKELASRSQAGLVSAAPSSR